MIVKEAGDVRNMEVCQRNLLAMSELCPTDRLRKLQRETSKSEATQAFWNSYLTIMQPRSQTMETQDSMFVTLVFNLALVRFFLSLYYFFINWKCLLYAIVPWD